MCFGDHENESSSETPKEKKRREKRGRKRNMENVAYEIQGMNVITSAGEFDVAGDE